MSILLFSLVVLGIVFLIGYTIWCIRLKKKGKIKSNGDN